jgi:hypothetical protein
MTTRHFAALMGFAFVAAWIALGFGDALLCVIGAGACYAIAAVREGDIDLGELQARVTRQPPGRGRTAPTRAIRRTRVQ